MTLPWRRDRAARSPAEVWAEWQAADEAGDAVRAGELASEMTRVAPGDFAAWFEAGLFSKARRDWAACAERNLRALELFTDADAEVYEGTNPAAWNLGIAATALGDWSTARRAWRAFGITAVGPGDDAIDEDWGLVPIRLNPDRPSLPHQVPAQHGDTEVVWCERRSPAHAVIANVPLPASGHRFGDVVLHDGEPRGERRLDGREVPVFDELERLEDSGMPTWQAEFVRVSAEDGEALMELAHSRGLGVDVWSGIRRLCSECSHGSPDHDHDHPASSSDTTMFGLGGTEGELSDCLDDWRADRPHIDVVGLEQLW